MNRAGWVVALVLAAAPSGCGEQRPAEPPKADAEDVPDLTFLNAVVLVDSCPDAKTVNLKAAHAAIRKLVAPCSKVPGGGAHFSATLLPSGHISLGAPGGGPSEGVVPTCVLQSGLNHRVTLRKDCKFDVQLEERKVTAP